MFLQLILLSYLSIGSALLLAMTVVVICGLTQSSPKRQGSSVRTKTPGLNRLAAQKSVQLGQNLCGFAQSD
jgi:hypothetical protein